MRGSLTHRFESPFSQVHSVLDKCLHSASSSTSNFRGVKRSSSTSSCPMQKTVPWQCMDKAIGPITGTTTLYVWAFSCENSLVASQLTGRCFLGLDRIVSFHLPRWRGEA